MEVPLDIERRDVDVVESRKARKAPKAATSSTAEEEGWRRHVSGACATGRLLGAVGP